MPQHGAAVVEARERVGEQAGLHVGKTARQISQLIAALADDRRRQMPFAHVARGIGQASQLAGEHTQHPQPQPDHTSRRAQPHPARGVETALHIAQKIAARHRHGDEPIQPRIVAQPGEAVLHFAPPVQGEATGARLIVQSGGGALHQGLVGGANERIG